MVTIPLDRRAFSYFDPSTREWRVNPGEFEILVGCARHAIVISHSAAS